MMIIAAFGPLMNLLLAVVFGLILRVAYMTGHTDWMYDAATDGYSISGMFVMAFLFRNLGLMFFNLIPIYPLDGSKILFGLLPVRQANAYDRLHEPVRVYDFDGPCVYGNQRSQPGAFPCDIYDSPPDNRGSLGILRFCVIVLG